MKRIITHGRKAHRDDFLAVALALAIYGVMPVFRRDPTEEELDDPEVLVLDVGGQHNPERNNFDHHQFHKSHEPECALSLFVRAQDLEDDFKLRPWWEFTVVKDAQGPRAAAKTLGLDSLHVGLQSPVESILLHMFSGKTWLSIEITELMKMFGKELLEYTKRYAQDYREVRSLVDIQEIGGEKTLVAHRSTGGTMNGILGRYHELEHPDAVLSISPSPDKGASWAIYRFDRADVDLSHLEGNSDIKFAHRSGHLAILRNGLKLQRAIDLAELAIIWDRQ